MTHKPDRKSLISYITPSLTQGVTKSLTLGSYETLIGANTAGFNNILSAASLSGLLDLSLTAESLIPEKKQLAPLLAIADAPTTNFVELISLSHLDTHQHLQFANWSEIDFAGCDLRGYDFTGARLRGCTFTDALIEGARFDQAEINGSNLRDAKDWDAYIKSWRTTSELSSDHHLPVGAVFQDSPFAPEMVVIPPGKFLMGSNEGEGNPSEWPVHEVAIPKAFAVSRYPVTFEEWDFAKADKGHQIGNLKLPRASDQGQGRGRRPVVGVSWIDARAYIKWLSHKTGMSYRLLSEAEWEYACRAGSHSAFCFGDDENKLEDYAWYDRNSSNRLHLVGQKKPNGFGLHDMHGNVWEWCEDLWHNNYMGKPRELGETGASWGAPGRATRVLRGGSWIIDAKNVRSAYRYSSDPNSRYFGYGFRVARNLNS